MAGTGCFHSSSYSLIWILEPFETICIYIIHTCCKQYNETLANKFYIFVMSCLKVIIYTLHYRCIRFDIIICIIMTYSVYIIKKLSYWTKKCFSIRLRRFVCLSTSTNFNSTSTNFNSTSTNFNSTSTNLYSTLTIFFSTSTNLDWNWYLDIWKWYVRNGNDMYMFVILSPLGKHMSATSCGTNLIVIKMPSGICWVVALI
jgi:hypothetical protein